MKFILIPLFLFLFAFSSDANVFYYGDGKAVNLENDIGYDKNTQLIKSGVTTDPQSTATDAGAGSILMKTDGSVFLKKDAGSTTNWKKFLDESTNLLSYIPTASSTQTGVLTNTDWSLFNGKQDAIGYTPENVANKSTNTALGTSDTLYPSQNAVKSYVDLQVKDIAATGPIVVTQDANTATISFDDTKAKQFGGAIVTPTFTDNGGGNVTINPVQVNLWDNSTFAGDAQRYTVGAITVTLTDNVTNYVVADYNAGTPILRVTTDVNEITESSIVPIFTIFRSGAFLHTLDWDNLGRGLANKVHQSIVKTQRYRRESGLAVSESGTRNVDLSAGIVWTGANKVSILSIASLTDNIQYFLRTGTSAWTNTSVTQYNNTQYWNGTTNATLTNGRYAVNWLYRGIESQKHLYMVIGEGDYNLAQAQASQPPSSLPAQITSHGLLVGRIIVLKNASTATQIDSAFSVVFTPTATTIHNDLGGLQGGAAAEYYHLTQAKYNAVENLTASGTQTNFAGDIQSASCVYYGDSVTNGSHRSCQVGGALIYQKRVSGAWLETYRVE